MTVSLPLRDVHSGIAPSWWPPAPGWWMVAAVVILIAAGIAWWRWRKSRHQNAILQLFNGALDRAETPSQQVAAMSELLRRAARRHNPAADRLEGDAWLQFLDDDEPGEPFSKGAGALLLEGGFRADVQEREVAVLRTLAQQRYLTWMRKK
ncbi:MAG: DUF4381 domain-containing protein [Pseudomonadota bacterium]|nr:DUF4381 domain-containing protein [Pseudomonadota bacterium]MDQ3161079.1 DUF4381 domain-containing protein [Pseudomonadota bacterium]